MELQEITYVWKGLACMAVLGSVYSDHTVIIYDTNNNHLITTVVTNHNKAERLIQVSRMPKELKHNDDCKLLILSSPTPCEYLGRVKKVGGVVSIAMFQGQEKESRGAARYAITATADIDALVINGEPYTLQTPVNVNLINISTSGMRFRAPYYTLVVDDIVQMHLVISNNKKRITTKVINCVDNKQASSDYGCRFLEVE
jgi:hypothetical protein